MNFNLQPTLENDAIFLRPLTVNDSDALYEMAADPALWEHYPIHDAYRESPFKVFFDEGIKNGSLVIIDKATQKIIGCTRFYNYDEVRSSVVIGHTFIAKQYWGSGCNQQVKALMLRHASRHVQKVLFYVVTGNIRSAKALEKLGATVTGEITREYNSRSLHCFVYEINL